MVKKQEDNTELLETLIKWAATRSDEVVFNPKEGFYSFDIVDDAYRKGFEKGKEMGENSFKEAMREQYFSKAKLVSEAIEKVLIGLHEHSYAPQRLFMRHSIGGSSLLLTIPSETHHSQEFISYAYGESMALQSEYYSKNNLNLEISYIDESTDLNVDLIKSDGYEFEYNLISPKANK